MRRCQAAGVPAGVVQTGADLAKDPQLAAAGFVVETDEPHPALGQTFADRLPLRLRSNPANRYRRSRRIGEDNAAVLQDWLGMDAAEVAQGENDGYLA